jgi:predicted acyl esterase
VTESACIRACTRLVRVFGATAIAAQALGCGNSSFVRQQYTKSEYRIPMRDGASLFTAVYVPNDASASNR